MTSQRCTTIPLLVRCQWWGPPPPKKVVSPAPRNLSNLLAEMISGHYIVLLLMYICMRARGETHANPVLKKKPVTRDNKRGRARPSSLTCIPHSNTPKLLMVTAILLRTFTSPIDSSCSVRCTYIHYYYSILSQGTFLGNNPTVHSHCSSTT